MVWYWYCANSPAKDRWYYEPVDLSATPPVLLASTRLASPTKRVRFDVALEPPEIAEPPAVDVVNAPLDLVPRSFWMKADDARSDQQADNDWQQANHHLFTQPVLPSSGERSTSFVAPVVSAPEESVPSQQGWGPRPDQLAVLAAAHTTLLPHWDIASAYLPPDSSSSLTAMFAYPPDAGPHLNSKTFRRSDFERS